MARARIHDQLHRHAAAIDRFDLGLTRFDLLSRIGAHAQESHVGLIHATRLRC
jgi:hypothetical protein